MPIDANQYRASAQTNPLLQKVPTATLQSSRCANVSGKSQRLPLALQQVQERGKSAELKISAVDNLSANSGIPKSEGGKGPSYWLSRDFFPRSDCVTLGHIAMHLTAGLVGSRIALFSFSKFTNIPRQREARRKQQPHVGCLVMPVGNQCRPDMSAVK